MSAEPAVVTPDATAIAAMSPAEAGVKLAELQGSQAWRGRYLSGSGPEVSAVQALLTKKGEGDQLDQIIAGTAKVSEFETASGGALTTYKAMQAAAWMKEAGLPPDAIRQAFEGKGVSAAEYNAAVNLRADKLGNKEWTAKYLSGEREAVREMNLLNIIITNGVAEEKKVA